MPEEQAPVQPVKKSGSPVVIILIIVAVIVLLAVAAIIAIYLYTRSLVSNAVKAIPTTTSISSAISPTASATVSAVDKAAAQQLAEKAAKGMAGPGIESVSIKDQIFYVAKDGTLWSRYTAVPTPVNAADPATGVLKKVAGGEWQGVDFGTAGLSSGLPDDVVAGLNLNSTL